MRVPEDVLLSLTPFRDELPPVSLERMAEMEKSALFLSVLELGLLQLPLLRDIFHIDLTAL